MRQTSFNIAAFLDQKVSQKNIFVILFVFAAFAIQAQTPRKPNAAELHQAIKKLNVLGSVLYVAAHPDDENTRLISYFANEKKYTTTYLSLTRGDGGQNLIGFEIRELLGVIRTQELLAARGVDGGNQLFSRANDFGFSKNATETMRIWEKKEVLADAVWAIRKLQPDVVINRFPTDTTFDTHGHHTASALISAEAFDLAADKKAYPEQLKFVAPHQAKRLMFNISWWFYGSKEKFEAADKSNMLAIDAGVFYPSKGKSNTEIAAESRSQHRCQGMGNTGVRGSEMEYVDFLKGEKPQKDIFEGINTSWSRLGEVAVPIGKLLAETEQKYSFDNPAASVPNLLKAYEMVQKLPDSYWKNTKLNDLQEVIKGCMGLYLEAAATGDFSATSGQSVEINLEAINRSNLKTQLNSVRFFGVEKDSLLRKELVNNQPFRLKNTITIPKNTPSTNPYWLNEHPTIGMYQVADQLLRGLPETPKPTKILFDLTIENTPIRFQTEVVFKKNDVVKGEMYRPFEITPPVFVNLSSKVFIFPNEDAKPVSVVVKAAANNISGSVSLAHPSDWRIEPAVIDFSLKTKGEEKTLTFQVFPPKNQGETVIRAQATVGGKIYDKDLTLIQYEHIPTQTVLRDAAAKLVRPDLKKLGQKIGYLAGAGDEVPICLRQMGYDVSMLEENDMTAEKLKNYDAIVTGIRAYNTVEKLKNYQPQLLEYVKNGGTLVQQYNTNSGLVMTDLGPYPFKISRDRVTVEQAEVRFVQPENAVLNTPNKISARDFDNWEQERGLYFASDCDSHYLMPLSCNDPNEKPNSGGLLIAPYGKGYYINTSYAWFRQLPAGVVGAYRLFANLLSIGKN